MADKLEVQQVIRRASGVTTYVLNADPRVSVRRSASGVLACLTCLGRAHCRHTAVVRRYRGEGRTDA